VASWLNEKSAGGKGTLIMATVALVKVPFADRAIGAVAAVRTRKAVRPSQLKNFKATFFYRSILLHEIWQTHALLKVNYGYRGVMVGLISINCITPACF
jgi:hypothetical protein